MHLSILKYIFYLYKLSLLVILYIFLYKGHLCHLKVIYLSFLSLSNPLSFLPNNQLNHLTFHSLSTYFQSSNNLSFYFLSFYFLFSSKKSLRVCYLTFSRKIIWRMYWFETLIQTDFFMSKTSTSIYQNFEVVEDSPLFKFTWNNLVPLKILLFAWRLLNDRLPTELNLI